MGGLVSWSALDGWCHFLVTCGGLLFPSGHWWVDLPSGIGLVLSFLGGLSMVAVVSGRALDGSCYFVAVRRPP